ncbi:restriction endonuclease subunit S [Pseudoxanthomonas sp. LjRoot125]|uniref:restriction endonuclease subunit S n=1 Tax=Pseudoxanthomonas sp. LjRoot125 TaxID=3342258 RepID=UPI003E11B332
MPELREHAFSDLYEMSSGISSTPAQAGHGAPFLSFSTVFNNYFLPDVLPDLMNTSESEQEAYSVREGDIFLTRTSETVDELGMSSVSLKDYPSATYSGFLKRLRPTAAGQTDPRFMAFYLRSPLFRKTMTNNAVMVLRASLNEQIFSYLKLLLPDFDTQTSIGEFLHLLSTKIDLNNRINTELDALAKTIYDYWFVQFDFPDAKGRPYKASGGKMAWNETLKREIPTGWEVRPLSSWIAKQKSGEWGTDRATGDSDAQVTCIRGADISALNGRGELNAPTRYVPPSKKEKHLAPYDMVVEISGGSPTQSTGRAALVGPEVIERFDAPLVCSNFCKALTLKDPVQAHQFFQQWNALYIAGIFFGWEGKTSGIKNLQFDSFVSSHHAPVPPDALANRFHELCRSLDQRKQNGLCENRELTQLRDWLLPLLMNGQVKPSDL